MAELPKIKEKINSEVDIVDVKSDIPLELHKVLFDKKIEQRKIRVNNVHFKRCLFSQKHLTNIIFMKCSFEKCQFNGALIENCEFHQCSFDECVFFKTEIENTYLDPSSFKYKSDWHIKWPNVNAWWFQALYQNSKKMYQEDFAMEADKRFLFYRRYEYLFGKNKYPVKFLKGLLYDLALGNGYGIWNALFFTCLFIALFALLIVSQTNLTHKMGPLDAIYFSVVSFTTVGYGEITPAKNIFALVTTTVFLFFSVVWGSIVTAVIVKRLVK